MSDTQCPDSFSVLDLEDTLKCPVCFELRDGHIFVCTSGHHVCNQCKTVLSECPICRCNISDCRNFVAETLISKYSFLKEIIDTGERIVSQNRVFDFSTSDFATIVKTSAFVDKTLMLKDIFNSSSQILITAPPRFGKSTNIDMVRRFLEIKVDSSGAREPVHTTENYKLFKENNLNICCHDEFFNEHFGKYPVINTDWKALGRASDFESMIDIFRTAIIETFSLHNYLLHVDNFWTDDLDINKFKQYLCEQLIKDLDEQDLMQSLKYLSRLLYRYFSKTVFILIDNCDAFVYSVLFKNNPDTDKIISFISTTLDNLLQNNHCVGRALLTGVLPVTGEGFPLHISNIEHCLFSHDHPFCKYYGLTTDQLDKVLDKLEKDGHKRNEMKKVIDGYYKYYVTENEKIQMYSMWSVLQYLHKRKVQSYWCSPECMSGLKSAIQNYTICKKVAELLSVEDFELKTSHKLSTDDILQLNYIIVDRTFENTCAVNTVFLILYHLGYFTINKNLGRGFMSLKIPNEEMKYELAKVFLYISSNWEYIENIKHVWSAMDSFQVVSVDLDNIFVTFDATLQVWSCIPFAGWDSPLFYLTHLFLALATTAENRETMFCKLSSDGPLVILTKNKHRVGICITAQEDKSCTPSVETREGTAANAHRHITDSNYEEQAFGKFSDLCGKVLIAVGYRSETFDDGVGFYISIVYSYQFKESDSLRNYTTL